MSKKQRKPNRIERIETVEKVIQSGFTYERPQQSADGIDRYHYGDADKEGYVEFKIDTTLRMSAKIEIEKRVDGLIASLVNANKEHITNKLSLSSKPEQHKAGFVRSLTDILEGRLSEIRIENKQGPHYIRPPKNILDWNWDIKKLDIDEPNRKYWNYRPEWDNQKPHEIPTVLIEAVGDLIHWLKTETEFEHSNPIKEALGEPLYNKLLFEENHVCKSLEHSQCGVIIKDNKFLPKKGRHKYKAIPIAVLDAVFKGGIKSGKEKSEIWNNLRTTYQFKADNWRNRNAALQGEVDEWTKYFKEYIEKIIHVNAHFVNLR